MAVQIVQKINVRIPGLKRGNIFLQDELSKAGERIGKHLQIKVRNKQRLDTGQERRRTLYKVKTPGGMLTVSVYNTVVQALVDETGRGVGKRMPPFGVGSKLFSWVERKGIARTFSGSERQYIATYYRTEARKGGASREEAKLAGRSALREAIDVQNKGTERVTFLIARAISRRGLPRPGDPLRRPFEVTRKEEKPTVVAMANAAVTRSINRINSFTR